MVANEWAHTFISLLRIWNSTLGDLVSSRDQIKISSLHTSERTWEHILRSPQEHTLAQEKACHYMQDFKRVNSQIILYQNICVLFCEIRFKIGYFILFFIKCCAELGRKTIKMPPLCFWSLLILLHGEFLDLYKLFSLAMRSIVNTMLKELVYLLAFISHYMRNCKCRGI